MERVAVVGGGPLAASVVRYLRARAFWVRAVEPAGELAGPENESVRLDLSNPASAAPAVAGVGHVYLLGLALPRNRPAKARGLDAEVQLVGRLLDAAVSARVNRVLYALPAHDQAPWCDAVDMIAPLLTKAAARGVETRFALLPNIYGPGVTDSVITDLAALAAGIASGIGPVVDVGADAEVPVEHIADATVGLYLLMRSNFRRPLLVAGPDRHRPSAVAAELSRLAVRPLVTAAQGQPPLFHPPHPLAGGVREALNWTPPTKLPAGLAHLVRDLSAGDSR